MACPPAASRAGVGVRALGLSDIHRDRGRGCKGRAARCAQRCSSTTPNPHHMRPARVNITTPPVSIPCTPTCRLQGGCSVPCRCLFPHSLVIPAHQLHPRGEELILYRIARCLSVDDEGRIANPLFPFTNQRPGRDGGECGTHPGPDGAGGSTVAPRPPTPCARPTHHLLRRADT